MDSFLVSKKSIWPDRIDPEIKSLLKQKKIILSENCEWAFGIEENKLSLKHLDFRNPLCLDLESDKEYNRKIQSVSKDLLLTALGFKKNQALHVLDMCGGMGRDAVFMARQGIQVTSVERNPIVYLLFKDALLRSEFENISWNFGSSIDFLKTAGSFTHIYIDPMFEKAKKSALPQIEMQYFRKLIGSDSDSNELLLAALKTDCKRIIVKRSDKGTYLAEIAPKHSWTGKSVRFDFYQPKTHKG